MDLIVGLDDFGEAVRSQLNFIDKSLFIKEIIDNKTTHVPVIIRPRRFGKTFNLSMLHYFLAAEVNGLKTQGMFDVLKIAKAGDSYMREQGKYPVIFVSFKSIKEKNFEDAYEKLSILLAEAYREHRYLLTSSQLYEEDKAAFGKILKTEVGNKAILENALKELTRLLYLHHGVKPWLLIDEYDTPIQSGYLHNYYEPMIDLMRGIFGSALKGNSNIHRAVITGILRIAKENLFSGVNNLKVFSVLNAEYAEHFGFTESEVDAALMAANLKGLSKQVKAWYNGYHIGNYQIYNPWSIANCINEKGLLKPHWVNTSDNLLIKQRMAQADSTLKVQFESILEGKSVEATIDETMVFTALEEDPDLLWSLLLFGGYLTATQIKQVGIKNQCVLTPPNQEVALLWRDIIADWFMGSLGQVRYQYFLQHLVEGKLDVFLEILQKFLLKSASYFDVKGNDPERFYHGFVMGLIVGLSDTHQIHSNKESGYGRYDVMIIPKDLKKLGLILEFKVAKANTTLQETADQALEQINARAYETELRQKGIRHILKIGLGFKGKEVALSSAMD